VFSSFSLREVKNMTASEKIVYLKGLAEGLGIDGSSNEGKLLLSMLEVMEGFASDIEDLESNLASMADAVNGMSEDIAYVESLALGEPEEDESAESEGCDGNCSACGGCGGATEFEVTCPTCGMVIELYDEDIEFGSIICPSCGEDLELEFDEDDGEDELNF